MSVAARAGMAALATALAEIVAREVIRRRADYYRYVPHMRVRYAVDRDALPELSPFARAEINEDGERGGPPPRADESAYRALVVGGSAAECMLLDQDATWPAVVQRILGEPDHARALGASRVHVGSVARAILPCADVDLLLSRILPRYKRLDLVLIMVGAADVVSWVERGMPRRMPEGRRDPSKIFEHHPETAWGLAPRSTALWRIASDLHRKVRGPLIEKPGGDWLHRVRRMRAEAETMIDEVPDATPMLDHFEKHLAALVGTARRAAPRVIIVRQPWRDHVEPGDEHQLWNFGLGRPYREEVKAYFTTRVVDALLRMVDERAVAVADRLGVEHVDLMPRIERSSRAFYDELHFTPWGAEVVGHIVAEAILGAAPRADARPSREGADGNAAPQRDAERMRRPRQ